VKRRKAQGPETLEAKPETRQLNFKSGILNFSMRNKTFEF
jgi:hypothetical protein